jgi:FKBP-type peptidyl-prolyl cis-trans isomerase FkpA
MKKWFFLFLGLPFFFAACKKSSSDACTYVESTTQATAAEIAHLDSFMTANSIANFVKHPSGVFYTIDSAGSGITATNLCSIVGVKYSGYLLGNTVTFDQNSDSLGTSLSLGGLIVGWQKVLPLIKAGGKVTLYIPPSLGYGDIDKRNANGDIIIPRNSYLKFKIDLLTVR